MDVYGPALGPRHPGSAWAPWLVPDRQRVLGIGGKYGSGIPFGAAVSGGSAGGSQPWCWVGIWRVLPTW